MAVTEAPKGAAVDAELPNLSPDEIKRYSRHLIMPEIGMDGQRRIKAGSVLCIGAGGLGSPAAMYLAAAGVGTPPATDGTMLSESPGFTGVCSRCR